MKKVISILCLTLVCFTSLVELVGVPGQPPHVTYYISTYYYESLTNRYADVPIVPFIAAKEFNYIIGIVLHGILYPFLKRERNRDIRYMIEDECGDEEVPTWSPLNHMFYKAYQPGTHIVWAERLDVHDLREYGEHDNHENLGLAGTPVNHRNPGRPVHHELAIGPAQPPCISYTLGKYYYESLRHTYMDVPRVPFIVAIEFNHIIGIVLHGILYPFLKREGNRDTRYMVDANKLWDEPIPTRSPLNHMFHKAYQTRRNLVWAERLDVYDLRQYGEHDNHENLGLAGTPVNHGYAVNPGSPACSDSSSVGSN